MKSSHRLWNIYYYSIDFIKSHKARLIVLLIVFIVGCAVGIKMGSGCDARLVLSERIDFALLVNAEKRNVVGYIFLNLFCYIFCFALLMLCGMNFYTSFIGVVLFFYGSYSVGYGAAVYFVYFKLAALPYIIVCYIPFCLVTSFTMGCVVSLAVDCGVAVRRNGCFHVEVFKERLPVLVLLALLTAVAVLCLGVFGGIFTSGLMI